jgi:hypothetical protein
METKYEDFIRDVLITIHMNLRELRAFRERSWVCKCALLNNKFDPSAVDSWWEPARSRSEVENIPAWG